MWTSHLRYHLRYQCYRIIVFWSHCTKLVTIGVMNDIVNVYVKNIGVKCGGSDSELLSTFAGEKYTRDEFKMGGDKVQGIFPLIFSSTVSTRETQCKINTWHSRTNVEGYSAGCSKHNNWPKKLWNHHQQLLTYSDPDCTTNCCEIR